MTEYRVSLEKDLSIRYRVTVFGGPGLHRNGNLYHNDRLSKSFDTKKEAEMYRTKLNNKGVN